MPRKVRVGAGMTAREVVAYDTRTEVKEISEKLHRKRSAIEQRGLFGVASEEAESVCRSILAEFQGEPAPDSPQDLARPILKFIEAAREAIDRDEADRAARLAFVAGLEWARAVMKWGWEPDALRGEKVAGGERNSAHQTNARHEALRNKRFARMEKLASQIGVDKAAEQCEVEGLGSRAAIKKQWNRHKKRDT